ncbi:chitin-binding type-2 domain-containing protein [Trichonephila inaurata madagascariensis]|uniref:Chitin-binding type-2 domain-containing protein n=1 Tax=Trichonephila inaurata madagascariensis TaxID=2747483 RepID=A0A8X6ILZ5_9ARAC|nr:chitin-binding type-2 domain-containing protein [Trichonephila inaurata madagascariensis]
MQNKTYFLYNPIKFGSTKFSFNFQASKAHICFPYIGIIIIAVDGKGNNWSQQGGNRWQNSDNLSSQSGIQGNIAQNQAGSGNGKAGKANYGQGGRGFTSRDIQVKNDGSFNNMRNSQNAGGWGLKILR